MRDEAVPRTTFDDLVTSFLELCRDVEFDPSQKRADDGKWSDGGGGGGSSKKKSAPKKPIIEQGTGYKIETEPDPNLPDLNGKPQVPRHGNFQAERAVSKHRPDMEKVSKLAYAIEEKNSGVDVDGKPLTKKKISALNQTIKDQYGMLKNYANSAPDEIAKAFEILGVDDKYIQSL